MSHIHQIHVRELTDGTYVCHGEFWHSLDNLKVQKDKLFSPYTLELKKADEATNAYWTVALKEGTVHFMD